MRFGRAGRSGSPDAAAGRLSQAGVEVHVDASGDALAASSGAGTLIKSPGVPQSAPVVVAARARGLPVLGELELAWRLVPNEFIAVTGTNGKTTTTEWIGHIHREAALPVAVVGNVGTAASSLIDHVAAGPTVVCEASSFQLEDTVAFAPEVAVLLNLEPDHLDRHGTFDAYVAAKLRIFANQGNDDVAVAPADLDVEDLGGCARPGHLRRRARAPTVGAGRLPVVGGGAAAAQRPRSRCRARTTAPTRWPPRPPACRAGWTATPSPPDCGRSPASLTGSSRSRSRTASPTSTTRRRPTSPARSSRCAATSGGVRLIAGGRGKQQDFSPLAPVVAERCAAVYLIGEAAGELAAALARQRRRGRRGRRPRAGGRGGASTPPSPGTPCCSRPPAPAMTSTGTSKRAGITSADWSRRSDGPGGRPAGTAEAAGLKLR